MADDGGGGSCGRCCCSFILTSAFTALFLWLSFRTYKPSCFVQDFYVAALNKSDNSRNNHSIFFTLKLKNRMRDKGVGYSNISIALLYNSTVPVANHTVPEFYQGHGKTAHLKQVLQATGLPWATAVSNGSNVSFRVKVATRVRYKIMLWFNKRHSLVVAGDVAVDDSGSNKKKKDVKLKSAGPHPGSGWLGMGLIPFFTFFHIFLL